MKVIYEFTDKEKELLIKLKSMNNEFSYAMRHDEFRNQYRDELVQFITYDLLFQYCPSSDSYITYKLTVTGLEQQQIILSSMTN